MFLLYMYYSQSKEDKILNDRYFKNKKCGVYVELGALDGVLYSNTKFFEDTLEWTGILIEPQLKQFQSLSKNRPNNYLFNELVSCKKEKLKFNLPCESHAAVAHIDYTAPHNNWFINKFSNENIIYMTPMSLTDIIKTTGISHIDFLSLDVEGHELEVLQSWDFSIPIDLILIELLGFNIIREEQCKKLLIDNGYRFIETIGGNNDIYILNTSPLIIL